MLTKTKESVLLKMGSQTHQTFLFPKPANKSKTNTCFISPLYVQQNMWGKYKFINNPKNFEL